MPECVRLPTSFGTAERRCLRLDSKPIDPNGSRDFDSLLKLSCNCWSTVHGQLGLGRGMPTGERYCCQVKTIPLGRNDRTKYWPRLQASMRSIQTTEVQDVGKWTHARWLLSLRSFLVVIVVIVSPYSKCCPTLLKGLLGLKRIGSYGIFLSLLWCRIYLPGKWWLIKAIILGWVLSH